MPPRTGQSLMVWLWGVPPSGKASLSASKPDPSVAGSGMAPRAPAYARLARLEGAVRRQLRSKTRSAQKIVFYLWGTNPLI